MHVEYGPHLGPCERWKRRSQSKLMAESCRRASAKVLPRVCWAPGSSKPEEIQVFVCQRCWMGSRRLRFQRHSTTSCLAGKIPMSRKGFTWARGNPLRTLALVAGESVTSDDFTISPRLTICPATRAGTEYQLISAKVVLASLIPIQVPPVGSEGKRVSRLSRRCCAGGRAATR